MRWAALDFETATHSRGSACAVGVVQIDDGAVVDERGWLIRPPGNRYEPWSIRIHGIEPAHTAARPAFDEVWAQVEPWLHGRLVFAHNAAFDVGVLTGSSGLTDAAPADLRYACTVSLARRAWPELRRHNLKAVCAHLGIDLVNHHDAVADAHACAEIALQAADVLGAAAVEDAARHLRLAQDCYATR